MSKSSSSSGTKVCRFFLQGRCTGNPCPFLHDAAAAATATPMPPASGPLEPQVCKFFLQGRCTRDNCRNLHPGQHPSSSTGNPQLSRPTHQSNHTTGSNNKSTGALESKEDSPNSINVSAASGDNTNHKQDNHKHGSKPPHAKTVPWWKLEEMVMNMQACDAVRLPSSLVFIIMEKAELIRQQSKVSVESISSVGLRLQGRPEKLCEARRDMCVYVDQLLVDYNLRRLLVEKFHFIFTTKDQGALAELSWTGRRILDSANGKVAVIKKFEIFPEEFRIMVGVHYEGEDTEDGDAASTADDASGKFTTITTNSASELVMREANELICWDTFGIPDSITVVHPDMGAANGSYLRRTFGSNLGLNIEYIEAVKKVGADRTISRITYDIAADIAASAKATIALELIALNSPHKFSILVSAPTIPVQQSVIQPTCIRIAGSHAIEEAEIRAIFQDFVIRRVKHTTGKQVATMVLFNHAEEAIRARTTVSLPASLHGFTMSLDTSKSNTLICKNVPMVVSNKELVQRLLLPAEDGPDQIKTRPGDQPGYRDVAMYFPFGSPTALDVCSRDPLVVFDQLPEDTLLNIRVTAEALIREIRMEIALERLKQSGYADVDGDDLSDTSSVSSSLSSLDQLSLSQKGVSNKSEVSSVDDAYQRTTLSKEDAVKQLQDIIAKSAAGNNNLSGRDISELTKITCDLVRKIWPRYKPRGICKFFQQFELGYCNISCPHGYLCAHQHVLEQCQAGTNCNRKHCFRIHPTDCQALLRLDVKLHTHVDRMLGTSGGHKQAMSLEVINAALSKHREAMLDESKTLLALHGERLQGLLNEVEQVKREQKHSQSMEDVSKKVNILEAVTSRYQEAQKQIKTFEASLDAFTQADHYSFQAARIFAREVYNRFKTCLPIYAEKHAILQAVKADFSVLILSAETGSGKSTQVVQYLTEHVHGKVLCTQPRRVAALTLAERVAEEMMTPPPSKDKSNLVAFKQKGGADCSKARILFLTDASLINQLYYQPLLPHISAVVVDEVHERSVNTDLLIALLRRTLSLRAQEGRHSFKLVLTSATMNEALFAAYFARYRWDLSSPTDETWAPVMKVGGRTYPVNIYYEASGSKPNYTAHAEEKVLQLHKKTPVTNLDQRQNFDFLVFLTQADECDRLVTSLQKQLPDCYIVSLHGSLEREEQQKAFAKTDSTLYKRKIVVSTNIAETSVTIDGIGVVIDCGLAKQAKYDPTKDATVLQVDFIAQSSAKQRAGRAGRTAAGDCYRLFSQEEFEDQMPKDMAAELLRSDAAEAVLSILFQIQRCTSWISNIREFPFVEHPGNERLEKALKLLYYIGALPSTESSMLTEIGLKMAKMDTSPRVSAILLEAYRLNILGMATVAVGMTQAAGTLFRRGRTDEEQQLTKKARVKFAKVFPNLGDIGSTLAVWFEARDQPQQNIKFWCQQHGINFRVLQDAQRNIRYLLRDMMDTCQGMEVVVDIAQQQQAGEDAADINDVLRTLSQDVFKDSNMVNLMYQAMLKGYFSNIAFCLPVLPGDKYAEPQYYLPAPNQLGTLPSSAAFRASNTFPEIAIYMEMVDNRKLYISSLFGMEMTTLTSCLPVAFQASEEFQKLMHANERKQLLSRTAVAKTDCILAFKKFLGIQVHDKLQSIISQMRKTFDIPKECELLIEADRFKSQLLVKCGQDGFREKIANTLQQQLDEVEHKLTLRRKEWAIPNSNVRAVVGTGGVVHELLFSHTQTISIRFNVNSLKQRMSEPITVLQGIPEGWFLSLLESELNTKVRDDEIFQCLSTYGNPGCAKAAEADISPGQTFAAVQYTAGPVCYTVNAYLRNLNEHACIQHDPYIRGLMAFHQIRSGLAKNKKGLRRLFRGCCLPKEIAQSYYSGAVVVWPAFTSTSTNEQVARMFAGAGGNSTVSVLFEISTEQYCPLKDVSVFPGEEEILLPCFSIFKVQSVEQYGGIQRVRLHHELDPSILKQAKKSGVEDSIKDEAPKAGGGPYVIKVSNDLPGDEGVIAELQRQLQLIDPLADVDICRDKQDGRIWGRTSFTSSELAAQALNVLNRSVIGDRELSVFATPVETESLSLKCRVQATMSAVVHNGYASVNCGGPDLVNVLLGPLLHTPEVMMGTAKKWNSINLKDGTIISATVFRKNKDAAPDLNWVSLSRVPTNFSELDVINALHNSYPALPKPIQVLFQRDKTQVEKESKALKQSNVVGTRERSAFLSSLVGPSIQYIEEKSLDQGAQYQLWFADQQTANHAATKLHNALYAPSQLRVSAVLDNSSEVIIPGNVYKLLQPSIQSIIKKAHSDCRVFEKKVKERHIISISSSNLMEMSRVYNELTALQRGTCINVAIKDRGKIFPGWKAKEQKERVDELVTRLSKTHNCVIRLNFSQLTIRVIGSAAAQTKAAQDIQAFLQGEFYERKIRIAGELRTKVQQWIQRQQQKMKADAGIESKESSDATESPPELQFVWDGSRLVVKGVNPDLVDEKFGEVTMIIEEANLRSTTTCVTCFEPCDTCLLTCSHTLCDSCSSQYCMSELFENRIPLKDPKCGKPLLVEDLCRICDNLDTVYMAGVRAFIIRNLDRFGYCHRTNCNQIISKDVDSVTCGSCMKTQCPKCGEFPHKGVSCEQAKADALFAQSDEGQAESHRKHILDRLAIPCCPSCHVAFIDFSGCYAVTCLNCNSNFCGFCLFNCRNGDAHGHVATCSFVRKNFNAQGYFQQESMFKNCMRIRLPELTAEYFRTIQSPAVQRIVYAKCEEVLKNSEFFDNQHFLTLMPDLK